MCTVRVYRAHMDEIVKRRLVWLTDSEWDRLNAEARRTGRNISNLIRERMLGAASVTVDRFGHPSPAPKPGKR